MQVVVYGSVFGVECELRQERGQTLVLTLAISQSDLPSGLIVGLGICD